MWVSSHGRGSPSGKAPAVWWDPGVGRNAVGGGGIFRIGRSQQRPSEGYECLAGAGVLQGPGGLSACWVEAR